MAMPAANQWPETEARIAEVARTRRGRHRDRALASYRRPRALELRARGLTYEKIAEEVGYSSRATAYNVITMALETREAESVEQLRAMELERLDLVHAALWDDAMAGKVGAVTALLRIVDARCRLLGLYDEPGKQSAKTRWDNCQGPPTVVVNPNDCRHGGCDRHGRF